MAKPASLILLIIFAIHLAVFSKLAVQFQKGYQWMGVLTFALLITDQILRIWVPIVPPIEYRIHFWLRTAAWLASGLTIGLYLRQRWKNR